MRKRRLLRRKRELRTRELLRMMRELLRMEKLLRKGRLVIRRLVREVSLLRGRVDCGVSTAGMGAESSSDLVDYILHKMGDQLRGRGLRRRNAAIAIGTQAVSDNFTRRRRSHIVLLIVECR